MGWTYPETLYWGRASVLEFGKFSKSILSDAIARGEYEGWDDPRLPTLRALRRRGFQAAAIRAFWLSFGLSEKDVAASMRTLESENRKVVEADAARYFFVADPTPLTIRGVAELRASAPLHPDHPDRGARAHHLRSRNDAITVELASQDAQGLRAGARVRLKDLANVELDSAASGRYAGNDLAFVESKSVPIVQWVPTDGLPTLLRMPDGTNVEGVSERAISKERLGSVVQLERVGYARVDALGPDRAVLYFSHK
jgi:glutamyl-tRNA synthetase